MTTSLLLVLDTATRRPTLALADREGRLLAARQWTSRHRHGEELLPQLESLLGEQGAEVRDVAGIVAGTGPGSFTGLRIGLATAKVLAYSLGVPIVGVPTTRALALAAADGAGDGELVVTLPAGAADRYVAPFAVRDGRATESAPQMLVAGDADGTDSRLVAVDFDDRGAPGDAIQRGDRALAGLAATLAGEGARRLSAGESDDVAELVPAYVALPRGIQRAAEDIRWSPDLR
jgi:tRNA threonylcarbamoyl adenosine modification protein YeaZ